ncbi:MAG: glycosyltransferase family 4 protein, partial [Thermoplasmata archaeon]|nr:glycosyltransferase family 4 protein [Thermoplasmata archaeon]
RDKGVHRFLDALAAISDRNVFCAVVAGAGPEEVAVRARLKDDPRLGSKVRFLGRIAEEEKPSLLSQSDLFVLPSTSDTSSVALLEAMASGAPCVASAVGGPGEMIADRITGRRFDPSEPPSLPDILGELLDDPDERARIAARGLDAVRTTASIDQTARRFISLYELLLSERGAHAVDHSG